MIAIFLKLIMLGMILNYELLPLLSQFFLKYPQSAVFTILFLLTSAGEELLAQSVSMRDQSIELTAPSLFKSPAKSVGKNITDPPARLIFVSLRAR